MSYIRGSNYIFADNEDRLHIWVADGEDNWEISGWGKNPNTNEWREEFSAPSGVSIPQSIIDQYVIMRFAEILEASKLSVMIDSTLKECGDNFNCTSLIKYHEQLKKLTITEP